MKKEFALVHIGGGGSLKFYTIKLPRFVGGLVRAVISTFKKD
ncbi:stage V sporulation protein SpoVM [Halobacillus dabanensis]|nr:stage V sporulation protein SpoVM [Halobacillus dabanensis]